ncbi:MAG: hypothetical protein H7Z15_15450 [Rhizobacter sp.]|nr:hypothetical protein [Rhizobacter sp.]
MSKSYLRLLDWKVVFFALLACYVLPGILVGTLLATVLQETMPQAVGNPIASILAFVSFLIPPVAGGYFAARFARSLPRLHVLVVGALGAVLSLLAFRASPRAMAAYALTSLALAALGGFMRLRSGPNDEA